MNVRVLKKVGQAAIIEFKDDNGHFQSCIISSDEVLGVREGDSTEIYHKIIEHGTEYGIDWTIVFPPDMVSIIDVQDALRAHGIWTFEDLLEKQPAVLAAINAVSKVVYMKMLEFAKSELGG